MLQSSSGLALASLSMSSTALLFALEDWHAVAVRLCLDHPGMTHPTREPSQELPRISVCTPFVRVFRPRVLTEPHSKTTLAAHRVYPLLHPKLSSPPRSSDSMLTDGMRRLGWNPSGISATVSRVQ